MTLVVGRLFTFFSASTHRRDILKEYVSITVKIIAESRYSAKHDAVKVIKSHYEKVLEALERLTEPIENADTRGDASVVLASIPKFQFISYLNMWGEILP